VATALLAVSASQPATVEQVESATGLTPENISVTASDRQVNVGAGGLVTMTTILSLPATETIVLKNMKGTVVRTLVNAKRAPGKYADTWDGKGDHRKRLKDDQYRWVATFSDRSHSFSIDNSKELDGDFELKSHPEYPPWDPFRGVPLRFSHTFERPGEIVLVFSRATFNVSPRCDPPEFFCRFLDGYWPAGEFAYEWAGADDSGVFRPDIHGIFVISHHEDLAKNAIVVYGGRPSITRLRVSPAQYQPDLGAQEVTFSLQTYQNERTRAVITWMNQVSRSVLRTLTLSDVRSGVATAAWDGRADNGVPVAPGDYTLSVRVTDTLGQEARSEIMTTVAY
jgi:flagellar hook assembly protein FlgD